MEAAEHVAVRRRRACLIAAALVLLPLPAAAQRISLEGVIRGRVLEDTTEAGINGVLVEVLDGATRIRGSAVSDAQGYFHLPSVPRGAFRLRTTRLGYAKTITPYWRIEAGEELTVVVRISPEAVMLAPLEITGRISSSSPVLANFYRRAERGIAGTFITRADIERSNATKLTDLLVNVPGVAIAAATASRGQVVSFERALPVVGSCPVQIYVDGMLASRNQINLPIDELVTPALLEGIEIYKGLGTVPPEFANPLARCGVIALWTRRGG